MVSSHPATLLAVLASWSSPVGPALRGVGVAEGLGQGGWAAPWDEGLVRVFLGGWLCQAVGENQGSPKTMGKGEGGDRGYGGREGNPQLREGRGRWVRSRSVAAVKKK